MNGIWGTEQCVRGCLWVVVIAWVVSAIKPGFLRTHGAPGFLENVTKPDL